MRHDTINTLIAKRDQAFQRGDLAEADRLTVELRKLATAAAPPARRAAARVMNHNQRRAVS